MVIWLLKLYGDEHSLNKFFYYSTYFAVVTTAAYARKKVRRAKWALIFSPSFVGTALEFPSTSSIPHVFYYWGVCSERISDVCKVPRKKPWLGMRVEIFFRASTNDIRGIFPPRPSLRVVLTFSLSGALNQ